MKILFLGDYSNLHACLAGELRELGHDVTVISDGGRYMDTARDILLDRKPGKAEAILYLGKLLSVVPKIKGYDVVQLINPHFLSLRPEKLKFLLNLIKRNNKSVFLTLAGNDWHFVNACINTDIFRFSEFRVGNEQTEFDRITHHSRNWLGAGMKEYAEFLYDNIDGAMSVLPEYDMASRPVLGDRLKFTNLPVDLQNVPYAPIDLSGKITLFIGMRSGMEIQKGTAMLLEMCRDIENKYPDLCTVECAKDLSLKEYLNRMSRSTIVLDQYYSYSPGTNGLQAMALGKIAGTGAQPEFYDYIGTSERPIIPLSPLLTVDKWETYLIELMADNERMKTMSIQGRKLVEANNDAKNVARKFVNHWSNRVN